MGDMQYQRAAAGFDQVASVYDTVYGAEGQNASVRWMKSENWAIVSSAFSDCQRILELGCGTGEDAVAMARTGKFVVATDISPAMTRAAAQRAQAMNLSSRILVRTTAAGKLESLTAEFGAQAFDGAYSSFTVAYEPELAAVNRRVAVLLRPGGKLVITTYSRACVWETAWWLFHGHPIGALRRWRRWPKSQIGAGQKIPAQHYAPSQLAKYFRPDFELQRVAALSLILPPPFLDPLYQKYRSFFDKFIPLERRVREWPLINGWGHAFVAVFQKQ